MYFEAAAIIVYVSKNATIKNNTKLILTCEALGNPMPVLGWMQDQKKILTTEDNRYQSKTENDFYFIDNKINDTDDCVKIIYDTAFKVKMSLYCIETRRNLETFSCFAINAFGQDYRTVSIETIFAPKFKNHSISLIEVLDGFPVTIICDVGGYPKPTVIWQRVGF